MGYELRYVQDTRSGKRYRRKVPVDARAEFNDKAVFVKSLGSTHSEIIRRFPKVHAEFEQRLERALDPTPETSDRTILILSSAVYLRRV